MTEIIAHNSRADLERLLDTSFSAAEYHLIKNDLPKECCWYLIGAYCGRRHSSGNERQRELFTQLGKGFGYSESMLRRFLTYARAIGRLEKTSPDIVAKIFSGELCISIENLGYLVKKPLAQLNKTVERIQAGTEKMIEIFPERYAGRSKPGSDACRAADAAPTVKNTPAYDPDALVMGLSYTIPSWITAIEHVFLSNRLEAVSKPARSKLLKELSALKNAADMMMELLWEDGKART